MKIDRSTRGYSLAELLVVVAMIGVISLVTVPQFMAMFRSAKLKSSLRQFTGDARASRARAVGKHKPVRLSLCNVEAGCDVSAITPSIVLPATPQGRAANLLLRNEYVIFENTTGTTWVRIPPGRPLGGVRQLDESVYFGNQLGDVTFTDATPGDNLLDITFQVDGTISDLDSAGTVVIRAIDDKLPKPVITVEFNRTGQLQARD
ncbi:MAG: pilus assembly FimT family protein [Thermoanaerobaculia bacterium]